MLTDYQAQVNITTADECWLKIDTSFQVHTILRRVKHFIYLLKNFIRFRHEAASTFLISSLFLFLLSAVNIFLIFTMVSKFDSSLELSPFDQAILRIVWRNEKGHIGNTWRHGFFYQKGHGTVPFYFSLDKTLWMWLRTLSKRCLFLFFSVKFDSCIQHFFYCRIKAIKNYMFSLSV